MIKEYLFIICKGYIPNLIITVAKLQMDNLTGTIHLLLIVGAILFQLSR
jgi:hypothetical protein